MDDTANAPCQYTLLHYQVLRRETKTTLFNNLLSSELAHLHIGLHQRQVRMLLMKWKYFIDLVLEAS